HQFMPIHRNQRNIRYNSRQYSVTTSLYPHKRHAGRSSRPESERALISLSVIEASTEGRSELEALVGSVNARERRQREHHQAQVLPRRPVRDVQVVKLRHLVEWYIA